MSSSLVNGQSGLVTHPCPPQVTADLNTVSAAEVEFTFAYQAAQQAQVHPAEIPVLLTDGGVGQAALPVDPGDIVTSPADEALGGGAQPDKALEPGDMGLGDTEPANAASATATAAPDPTDTASASTSEEAFPRKNLDTSANQNLDPDAESFAPGAPAERPPAAAADNVTAPRAGAEREPSALAAPAALVRLTSGGSPEDGLATRTPLELGSAPPAAPGPGSASNERELPPIAAGPPKPSLPVSTSMDEYATVAETRRKLIPEMKLGCLYAWLGVGFNHFSRISLAPRRHISPHTCHMPSNL